MKSMTEHYFQYRFTENEMLTTSVKQTAIAEELCIDPVKFDRVICDFAHQISALFHDGDEPLNGDENRSISECVLDMLDFVHGNKNQDL